jgi:hypothetical protein
MIEADQQAESPKNRIYFCDDQFSFGAWWAGRSIQLL